MFSFQNACFPEGFMVVAKGKGDEALKIEQLAKEHKRCVIEDMELTHHIYEEIELDVPFTKYKKALIFNMEEFRLIETGSKR